MELSKFDFRTFLSNFVSVLGKWAPKNPDLHKINKRYNALDMKQLYIYLFFRARKKFLKVRTRTHAHSKFSKDAHAHARARERIFKVRTRTHAHAKIPSFLELWSIGGTVETFEWQI